METYSNPTSRAVQRYYWQFGLSMAAYVIVILLSRWMWHNANGRWQTVVALFPMIPAVFVFASIVRYLLATDELLRRIAVVSLALAGGATALIAVTYGLGGKQEFLQAFREEDCADHRADENGGPVGECGKEPFRGHGSGSAICRQPCPALRSSKGRDTTRCAALRKMSARQKRAG